MHVFGVEALVRRVRKVGEWSPHLMYTAFGFKYFWVFGRMAVTIMTRIGSEVSCYVLVDIQARYVAMGGQAWVYSRQQVQSLGLFCVRTPGTSFHSLWDQGWLGGCCSCS